MEGRKPPGVTWESWIDTIVREARERGEFDGLPGAGKPLGDLDRPHDELWWVRKKLKEEGVSYLPPALALRKERDDTLAKILAEPREQRVREIVTELNEKIRQLNRGAVSGPPSNLMPLDLESVVAGWARSRQALAAEQARRQEKEAASPAPPPRRRFPRLGGGRFASA